MTHRVQRSSYVSCRRHSRERLHAAPLGGVASSRSFTALRRACISIHSALAGSAARLDRRSRAVATLLTSQSVTSMTAMSDLAPHPHAPAPQGSATAGTARRGARAVRRERLRRDARRGGRRARRRLEGHAVPLLPEQGRAAQGGDRASSLSAQIADGAAEVAGSSAAPTSELLRDAARALVAARVRQQPGLGHLQDHHHRGAQLPRDRRVLRRRSDRARPAADRRG